MTKVIANIARILLGLLFVGAVLFRLFATSEQIATMGFPPAAQGWLDVMAATGYLQLLLYVAEFSAGVALLLGVFVPLALITLTPIFVNIALFHIFLDPRPARLLLIMFMLSAYSLLVYVYRGAFTLLMQSNKPVWSRLSSRSFNRLFFLRLLLGLMFAIPGIAKLLIPAQLSVGDMLVDGMKSTGYLYSLLGFTEFLTGAMLLSGLFMPLALILSASITLNILFYHIFLAPAGLVIALILTAAHTVLISAHADAYRSLLMTKVSLTRT